MNGDLNFKVGKKHDAYIIFVRVKKKEINHNHDLCRVDKVIDINYYLKLDFKVDLKIVKIFNFGAVKVLFWEVESYFRY